MASKVIACLYEDKLIGTKKQVLAIVDMLIDELNVSICHYPIKRSFLSKLVSVRFFNALPKLLQKIILNPIAIEQDVIILAGKCAVLYAIYYKHIKSTIVIMDPRINPSNFTFVIAPFHDKLIEKYGKNNNIIEIHGALNNFSYQSFDSDFNFLLNTKKHIAVLLGGKSQHAKYNRKLANQLLEHLKEVSNNLNDCGFLIVPSRRTKIQWLNYFINKLKTSNLKYHLYENNCDYKNILNKSDVIIVMQDSISMSSEACFFNKPVFIYNLEIKNKKFIKYYDYLSKNHYIKYCQKINIVNYLNNSKKLDELGRIKHKILKIVTNLF